MEQNIKIISGGLKCDNPKCDWRDDTVNSQDYAKWLNKPCPKCGENVLTEEDYRNAELLLATAHLTNLIPKETLDEWSKNPKYNEEELKKHNLFKDAEGIENLNGEKGNVILHFQTHGETKVTKIEKI